MREQAKKMNVASLRSAEAQATSAECRLAKVALMTISLWFMAWTPYLAINFTGIFQLGTISRESIFIFRIEIFSYFSIQNI